MTYLTYESRPMLNIDYENASDVKAEIDRLRTKLESAWSEKEEIGNMLALDKFGYYDTVEGGAFFYELLERDSKNNSIVSRLERLVEKLEGIYYPMKDREDAQRLHKDAGGHAVMSEGAL